MEIGNLGDKYYARLDQSDSHGRSIINQINVLVKQGLCTGEILFFYRKWKGHWRCPRLGTCFAEYLPVRIFVSGVTQGSGEMTADAPVIPRSKLLKSEWTIGGA